MRISGFGRAKRVAKRIINQFAPGGIILLYHRVAEVPSDPFKLCVKPHHFEEHLEVLKQHCQVVSLQQIAQNLLDGNSVNRWAAITFDDGYADNLYNAKPLLEKYDIPATVFVTTANLENEQEFWWDELDRLLLQPGTLPKTLSLSINSNTYKWDLGEAAASYSEEDFERNRTWTWYAPENTDPSERHHLYRELYQILHSVPMDERQKLLGYLLVWSGKDSFRRSTHRSLFPSEVHALQKDSLVEVGAHTVNHPFLSTLSTTKQQYELKQSKTYLEEIIGRPVSSFAYPHGDYTAQTAAIACEVGFTCACSTVPKKVRRNSNFFQLPRLEVQDWNGEEFEKQLTKWLYFET